MVLTIREKSKNFLRRCASSAFLRLSISPSPSAAFRRKPRSAGNTALKNLYSWPLKAASERAFPVPPRRLFLESAGNPAENFPVRRGKSSAVQRFPAMNTASKVK